MSSNERVPPKSAARGTNRRTDINPIPANTTQSQTIRNTQYPDDEFLLMEDDEFASNPPRPASSAIRINQPSPPGRRASRDVSTETQQTRRAAPPPPTAYAQQPRRTQRQEPRPASPQAPARTARNTRNTTAAYDTPLASVPRKDGRNIHWLLYVGMGMIAALALWALSTSVLTWGANKYNDFIYGNPRTFQIDAVVGHNDSARNPSHFIAVNLHGQVIIFELPGGDPSKAIDYTGPDMVGPGDDQIPITLSFSDMNHDGKIDMIVHISDRSIIFYNNGTKFVPQAPGSTPTS